MAIVRDRDDRPRRSRTMRRDGVPAGGVGLADGVRDRRDFGRALVALEAAPETPRRGGAAARLDATMIG